MNEQPEALRLAEGNERDQLRAEVDALRADRDSWRQQASDRVDDAVRFAAERDALRAEVDRLNAKCKDAMRAMREMRSLRADAERYRQIARINGWDERDDAEIDAARGRA